MTDELHDELVALLDSLGAKDAATARSLDDLFRAGRLPFGHLNGGIQALLKQGQILRVDRGGEGYYYLS